MTQYLQRHWRRALCPRERCPQPGIGGAAPSQRKCSEVPYTRTFKPRALKAANAHARVQARHSGPACCTLPHACILYQYCASVYCTVQFCIECSALSCFSCARLCDPMDYSFPASSVHEVLQARILEWVAMPSSRGSPPRD